MELTQIQGQNPGQRIPVQGFNPINIGSAPGSHIVHQGLPGQAAQITSNQEGQRILNPIQKTSPVMVNGQLVGGPTPISRGDTISIGNNNDLILGAHAQGENLTPQQIGRHLSSLNFSQDQIEEITNRIFDVKINRAIHKPAIIAGIILSLLGIGVVYAFLQVSDLNKKISATSAELDKKIIAANSTIQDFETVLGIKISGADTECDPELEDCTANESQSVDQRIIDLNTKISDVSKKLSDVSKQFDSIKSDLVKTVENAIGGSGVQVLQSVIVAELQKGSLSDFQKKIDELSKNFTLLDNALGDQVDLMKADIKGLNDYKEDLKSLKDVRKFMASYDGDKAVTEKNIKLIQEDIKGINDSLESLKKTDGSLDGSIKTITDRLAILENRVKELQQK